MAIDHSGRVALVTGGATGIGAACVERLAREGADVLCCYNKSADSAQKLADKLKAEGITVAITRCNVADSAEVRAAVDLAVKEFGRPVAILVNNAGDIFRSQTIEEMDEELWDLAIGVNLKGIFLCSKYCIPGMKQAGFGRIINMCSISGRSGGAVGAAHYAASKGGAEALTRALAKELGPYGITSNGVSPGVVYTPIHERFNTPESLEKLRQTIPLQRIGAVEDIAATVSFLASEEAGYITGEVIAVNGGMRMD